MRPIVKPTDTSTKEIMRIARGRDNKNTIFINIWTGEVKGKYYVRYGQGEELKPYPRDAYEFHFERSKPFMSYVELNQEIQEQCEERHLAIREEIFDLKKEIGRVMEPWDSKEEFERSARAVRERLEFLEGS